MRILLNPKFEEEIRRQVEYRNGLVQKANEVTNIAKAIAPVGKGPYPPSHVGEPGDYKRGLKTVVDGPNVYVSGTDYKSHWVEWGSVNNRRHATIRRAARRAGLELDEFPRHSTGRRLPSFVIRDVG